MKKLIIFLLLINSINTKAQESDLGNWLIYFGNLQINEKTNWHNEIQYRNYNAIGDMEQLLLRTGYGYDLTPNNNNLLIGYGFIQSQNYEQGNDEKVIINEHRTFLQYITRQAFSRVRFQHRYRFEQRWVEEDFSFRFRYFLSLNILLNNSEFDNDTYYISIYNEIFLNSEITIFDRNRTYLGLGYKLSQMFRFEIGYMNQFLNNFSRDQINLITFLNI
jgi:hypothetical protein